MDIAERPTSSFGIYDESLQIHNKMQLAMFFFIIF